MPWLKFRLQVERQQAEAVAEGLEACGAVAVSLEDAGDEALFALGVEDNTPLWGQTWVIGLFPSETNPDVILACCQRSCPALREALMGPQGASHAGIKCDSEILPDQDWERAWLTQFKPLYFGGDLWICPSWYSPPAPTATNIILDPGLAFGTGTHPTTALCLEWLAHQGKINLSHKAIIDYGCGSGVLAIAALKLGAATAWGVDIDARALDTSRENATNNGVAGQLLLMLPEDLPLTLQADIVMANILADPLIQLAPLLTSLVKARGCLLLSGLLAEQITAVRLAYTSSFSFEVQQRDGWALLIGNKLSPP